MLKVAILFLVFGTGALLGAEALSSGEFHWTVGAPVVSAATRTDDPCYSIKDPSVIRFQGRWHLFCTIRSVKRTHQIEYLVLASVTGALAQGKTQEAKSTLTAALPALSPQSRELAWFALVQRLAGI